MLLMKHKQHGFTNILLQEEAEHIKNGWERVEPINLPAVVSLEEQYMNKFGKRPHHRMNPKSIKHALEG